MKNLKFTTLALLVLVCTSCDKEASGDQESNTITYPVMYTASADSSSNGVAQDHQISFNAAGTPDFTISFLSHSSVISGNVLNEYSVLIKSNADWTLATLNDGGMKQVNFSHSVIDTNGGILRETQYFETTCNELGNDADYATPNSVVHAQSAYTTSADLLGFSWQNTGDTLNLQYNKRKHFGYEYVDSVNRYVGVEWVIPAMCNPIPIDQWVYVPFTKSDQTQYGFIKLKLFNNNQSFTVEEVRVFVS